MSADATASSAAPPQAPQRHRKLRSANVAFGDHLSRHGALDHQRRLQRVDVVRQGGKIGVHARN
jgi:hypothetical protein